MIIPVYNAEKHLKETINSIINQSIGFNNIELILVDDFSTDNSKKKSLKNMQKFIIILYHFTLAKIMEIQVLVEILD